MVLRCISLCETFHSTSTKEDTFRIGLEMDLKENNAFLYSGLARNLYMIHIMSWKLSFYMQAE